VERGRGGVAASATAAKSRGGREAHRRGAPVATGLVSAQVVGCAVEPDVSNSQGDE
jgi:hypothetical protein